MSEKHSLVKPPSVANTRRGVGFARTAELNFLREDRTGIRVRPESSSRAGTGSVGERKSIFPALVIFREIARHAGRVYLVAGSVRTDAVYVT